jgi:hypothetical protein
MGLPPCHILRRKSPSYPGVDLCATQLHGEGTNGTTWPQRHLHIRLSLTNQWNSAAEKSPQNFRTHQSLDDLQQGLQHVEVSPSHTILLAGMGDGTATQKHGEKRVGIVPQ